MNTKEAIEFLEKNKVKSIKNRCCYGNAYIPNDNDINQVISLLQRGEKYRQIVEEIKNIFKVRKSRNGGEWTGNNLLLNIYDIEEKYFPKE